MHFVTNFFCIDATFVNGLIQPTNQKSIFGSMGSVSIATYLCAILLTIFLQGLWKVSLKFWHALPFYVYLEEFPIIISQSCFRRTIFPFLYWKGCILSPAWLAHDSSMYSSIKINQKMAKKNINHNAES